MIWICSPSYTNRVFHILREVTWSGFAIHLTQIACFISYEKLHDLDLRRETCPNNTPHVYLTYVPRNGNYFSSINKNVSEQEHSPVSSNSTFLEALHSTAAAARHSLKKTPMLFISLWFWGNSQSRSSPWKPWLLANAMLESMNTFLVEALLTIVAKSDWFDDAPPTDSSVLTWGLDANAVATNILYWPPSSAAAGGMHLYVVGSIPANAYHTCVSKFRLRCAVEVPPNQ